MLVFLHLHFKFAKIERERESKQMKGVRIVGIELLQMFHDHQFRFFSLSLSLREDEKRSYDDYLQITSNLDEYSSSLLTSES